MDELFKMLERGEMPNFAQMLKALNDVSDINWAAVEDARLTPREAIQPARVPDYLFEACAEFCETC